MNSKSDDTEDEVPVTLTGRGNVVLVCYGPVIFTDHSLSGLLQELGDADVQNGEHSAVHFLKRRRGRGAGGGGGA